MIRLSAENARALTRPGCSGMRAFSIMESERGYITALFLSADATSDEHTAPYDQWLTVTRGSGWVSVDNEKTRVNAGDVITLPKDVFHRFWTENETMDTLVFALERVRGVEVVRLAHRRAIAENAAQRFVHNAQDAMRARGRFTVALSGGSTPRELYQLLATPEFSSRIEWHRVHLFWGDERTVPPDYPDSNFKMANDALISRVPIPVENVHRLRGEIAPDDAAREYEELLREFFSSDMSLRAQRSNLSNSNNEIASSQTTLLAMTQTNPRSPAAIRVPVFDLILLGLGPDAHTASLFPHTPVLREASRWVTAPYVEKLKTYRITLTPPLINAAENILFLVAGADKADAVHAVLRGDYASDDFPAQLIQPAQGKVTWLLDQAASQKITA